jgi:hypothetical protein
VRGEVDLTDVPIRTGTVFTALVSDLYPRASSVGAP